MTARAGIVVFQKELKELLRDKRTLVVGILIPIVIFPLVFGFMNLNQRHNMQTMERNLKISLTGKSSALQAYLSEQSGMHLVLTHVPEREVEQGKAYAALILPDDLDGRIAAGETAEARIVFDASQQLSVRAAARLKSLLEAYAQEIVRLRWAEQGMDIRLLEPLAIREQAADAKTAGAGLMLLSLILPLLLVVYSATSPLAAAVDLGAGEKERATIEPLLATPARRLDLLLGKFLAITVTGVIGVMAFMVGFAISYQMSPDLFAGEKLPLLVHPLSVTGIALLTVVLTMIFAAVELALSIYARSSKEAQTYLAPLALISMAAGYSPFMMDSKTIGIHYFHIPLVNISMVIKELVLGVYQPLHITVTLLWALVYIVLALIFARWMFYREEVIFRS
ncbi:ABC transporter permease [candidate division FCPU426 bacterium]|nr:ABC transporter permease [candidate division FCPU426 bacterium]